MDNLCLNYLPARRIIFRCLDDLSLGRCRLVSKTFLLAVNDGKELWKRIIQRFFETELNSCPNWDLFEVQCTEWNITILKNAPNNVIKELATAIRDFYKDENTNEDLFSNFLMKTKIYKSRFKDNDLPFPLDIVAECGLVKSCEYIIKYTSRQQFGVKPDQNVGHYSSITGVNKQLREETPLHIAAKNGHYDVFKMMFDSCNQYHNAPKVENGPTPLHYAALNGHLDICRLIIDKVEDKNPACNFRTKVTGITPLHLAAGKGHFQICQLIIDNMKFKNPADSKGITPLHKSAEKGHYEIFRYIFEKVEENNPSDGVGCTPLHNSTIKGHLKICQLIVDKINDKNPKNVDGCTPLHFAAEKGHHEIFKYILEKVEEENPVNGIETTPLHLAAASGCLEICKLICQNIDEKNPKDLEGTTPLDIACNNKYWKVAHFLIVENKLHL